MKATFPTTLKKSVLMIALSLALPLTAQAATTAATPAADKMAASPGVNNTNYSDRANMKTRAPTARPCKTH